MLNHGRIARSISFNHEILHHNGSGDQNGVEPLAEDDPRLPLENTQNNPHLLGIFNEVQITHPDSESSEQIEDAEDEVLNQQIEGIDV
ncbi:putative rotatin [Sesbania bispinosa]|nr:putative rotatin [Sesbania bispinosa]